MHRAGRRSASSLVLSLGMRGPLCILALALACKPAVERAGPSAPDAAAGEWIRTPAEFLRDLVEVEKIAGQIQASIADPFTRALRDQRYEVAFASVTPDFAARLPKPPGAPASGPQHVERLVVEGAADPAKALGAWLESLVAVERASWRAFRVLVEPRRAYAHVLAHFSVAGSTKQGARASWAGTLEIEVTPGQRDAWVLRRLAVLEGEYVLSATAPFVDVSDLTGFVVPESAEDRENARTLIDLRQLTQSGGLTVLDYDEDGRWDYLVTRQGRGAALLLNDGRGGFTRAPLPAIAAKDAARFYLWLDLDEDGANELVSTTIGSRGGDPSLVLYTFKGGKMRALPDRLSFKVPSWMRGMEFESLTACDVNGDGRLDLLATGYSHWGSARESFNLVDAQDGLRNLLFINEGNLKFSEEAERRGIRGARFTFAVECLDFDGDGDQDVFFGNDYATNDYFENRGQGRFVADLSHPFVESHGFSMGVSVADYDNSGTFSVSVSNMYSHAGHRALSLVEGLSPKMMGVLRGYASGNVLYTPVKGQWKDVAAERGVQLGDWAWGNVFFDADNDRDKDHYVVNGFTTNEDPSAPDW